MYLVSAALDAPELPAVPDGLSYGAPVAFAGCSGFLHGANGSVGVVLCSPWGFEELTMRKSWRLLAESIAAAGYPCLRFDYPGTGDSLGRATEVGSVDVWIESIKNAADFLRSKSGVRTFVFLGQSLGATLAVAAAQRRTDVDGLILVAPVMKGRSYVRELAATAALVSQRVGIAVEPGPDEALSVIGFALSPSMVDSLKGLALTACERTDAAVVVFDSSDRKTGAEAFEHFRKIGARVQAETVAPFHLMISDATVVQPLPVSPEQVVAALRHNHPTQPFSGGRPTLLPPVLATDAFQEEPIRFGPDNALFGVLCRPTRPRADGSAVLLLNRGLNPHTGWRRVSVDHARALAAAGFANLRMDVAGLGESRDEPGRPANLIYSDLLLPDVRAATDVLAATDPGGIALVGVCSGAYMALLAARNDPRVTHVVAVNPQRLVWNPAESVEEVIRFGLRSMSDYMGDLRSGRRAAMRKLITSRKRVIPALRFLAMRKVKAATARLPIGLRSALLPNSQAARVHAAFDELAARGTLVSLVFSVGDPGLEELRQFFGANGRALRYPNVGISLVPDADHNFTSTRTADKLLQLTTSALERPFGAAAPATAAGEARGHTGRGLGHIASA